MATINGLPAHVLLVHLVVVLIPVTSVLVVLVALWPAARRRLAVPTAVLAAVALIAVPVTTDAGEWLEHHLPRTPLLRVHTHLGDQMLPWAIGLFLVAAALATREVVARRRASSSGRLVATGGPGTATAPVGTDPAPGGRPLTAALAVLALVAAVGSAVMVVRIGEAGTRAAWDGRVSATVVPAGPRPPAGG